MMGGLRLDSHAAYSDTELLMIEICGHLKLMPFVGQKLRWSSVWLHGYVLKYGSEHRDLDGSRNFKQSVLKLGENGFNGSNILKSNSHSPYITAGELPRLFFPYNSGTVKVKNYALWKLFLQCVGYKVQKLSGYPQSFFQYGGRN